MDYKSLGLKCGLEIHQQLDTGKLFCDCPSILQEREPDLIIKRKLHAVAGELGEIDPAAMQAALRGATYVYQFYNDSNCLVELDEEPPHQLNKEALGAALLLSTMLNAKLVDEIHIMRKTVIDGSNTAGFQRTALISTNGELKLRTGDRIGIQTICLEEDAARIISAKPDEIVYNLDRLGVPLIEIATSPHITSPEMAREVALTLGLLLRSTSRVKRGIGTIRQDLNISIAHGARVEIKGIQELNLLPKVVENEVIRQVALLSLREDLRIRNAPYAEKKFFDVSQIFTTSQSKIIKSALEFGKEVYALKLLKLAGLLKKEVSPGRRFGTELADYAKSVGASGIFHSDELPAYGITFDEVMRVKTALSLTDNDAYILIVDTKDVAEKSLNAVVDRINLAFEKLPVETRKANADGTTSYIRPLPGGARMYPETDLMPIVVQSKIISEIKKKLPKPPWERIKQIEKKYKLSNELAAALYNENKVSLFEKLCEQTKAEPSVIANTLTNIWNSLNPEVELSAKHFLDLFKSLKAGKFSKEAIPQILEGWLKNLNKDLSGIISDLGLEKISRAELEKIIDKVVSENVKIIAEKREAAIQPLMGDIMREVRGRADGKLVMEILRKKLGYEK